MEATEPAGGILSSNSPRVVDWVPPLADWQPCLTKEQGISVTAVGDNAFEPVCSDFSLLAVGTLDPTPG